MKYFLLVLPLALLFSCHDKEQVTVYNGEKFLEFNLQFPIDSISKEIDWNREKPVSEFTLNGKTPLRYSVALKNDTIAVLSQFYDGKWELQENISYTEWAVSRIENNKIISEFKITDFDNDGDEDLVCWANTNVNGNVWTVIFLNDQNTKKLVKLYNTADNTDIWDMPQYDAATGTINCTLNGSAYGASEESSYKLENITAKPITKSRQDRYDSEEIIDIDYVGKSGKWEIIKTTKENTEP